MNSEMAMNAFLVIMIVIAVIAVIREIICWYWKINEGIELQKKILAELVKFNTASRID
jgi:preprotein translocase subunit SecF